jgi:hypothetical protein
MVVVPAPAVALQKHHIECIRGYRLHTNVQARRAAAELAARFMNTRQRQLSYYSASRLFRAQGRLTGFGRARNIIRIRTRCPAAATRYDRDRLNRFDDVSLPFWPSDSLTLARELVDAD